MPTIAKDDEKLLKRIKTEKRLTINMQIYVGNIFIYGFMFKNRILLFY